MLIGVIYNHPRKNVTSFLEYLHTTLNKINHENKTVLLAGDFNLNLLKHDKFPNVESFLNLMLANFYKPLITHPTRLNASSCPSLIDNIFINSLEHKTTSGNLIDIISDHLANFTFVASEKIKNQDKAVTRDYHAFNLKNYIEEFNNLDFDTNLNFQSKVLDIINKHLSKPETK